MKNLFIVIDGLDGSGKGEQIARLADYLFSQGYNVLKTFEPTDGEIGKKIRQKLKEEKDPMEKAEEILDLFCKDRKEHLDSQINPFLNNGEKKIVICDRYYHSTIAFQSTQGIDKKRLIELNKDFRKPDLTFILDLDPEISIERIEKRGKSKEKFEQIEFMINLRKNFLELPNLLNENIKIIDASESIDKVFTQIISEINILLK